MTDRHDIEELAQRVADAPPRVQIDFLLRALERAHNRKAAITAERDRLAERAITAERQLADLHQLISDSVAAVLEAAGPDDHTPAVQRLRQLEGT
jgi:predicted  nucleic acid-binding Zn-ribbon protein